jgi:hypothetical protein
MVNIPADVVEQVEFGISIAMADVEADLEAFICNSPECSYEDIEDQAWNKRFPDPENDELWKKRDTTPLPIVSILMKDYLEQTKNKISHYQYVQQRFCRTSSSAQLITEAKSVLNEARQSMRYKAAKSTKRVLGDRDTPKDKQAREDYKWRIKRFVLAYNRLHDFVAVPFSTKAEPIPTMKTLFKGFKVNSWDELERKAMRMLHAHRRGEIPDVDKFSGIRSDNYRDSIGVVHRPKVVIPKRK